jgi:serine O-acetyltransferase
MGWRSDFWSDVRRYRAESRESAFKLVLLEPGLWALLVYRIHAAVYRGRMPGMLKRPAHLALSLADKMVEIVTAIRLPCTAVIGPGLHLPHCGGRVLHAGVRIGRDCCLTQGVTVGISGRGERRGVPEIGDRVYLGANAVVAGRIRVGNDVLVGANSLVNRDVPPHCTVVGVPACVVSDQGSEAYLQGVMSERESGNAPIAQVH